MDQQPGIAPFNPFRFNHVLILGCFLTLLFNGAQAQSATATLHIETSAICEMCKNRLETELGYLRGIKSVNLNLDTKVLTLVYKPKKQSPEFIRQKISGLGYRADTVAADPKAFEALPACCQAEGLHHR